KWTSWLNSIGLLEKLVMVKEVLSRISLEWCPQLELCCGQIAGRSERLAKFRRLKRVARARQRKQEMCQ
ncbi:MAG: hypothetical protein VX311_07370, partial [Planctomycetota bacterium]|nr:hypothetical protein [Planctomycetota bacterium]